MRWLAGVPSQMQRCGEYTYCYRGQVYFQIERSPMMWWCHDGYPTPRTLEDRKWDRRWNDRTPIVLNMCREDGWGSVTKNALLRKIARSIDRDLKKAMRDDIRYLEAKGIKGLSV